MGSIVIGIENVPPHAKGGAITIGNFDGVHLGHRELISQLRKLADELSGPAVVLTFDPPPARLLRPSMAPPALTWMERRAEILFDLGIDIVCVCETTDRLLELAAGEFYKTFLIDALGVMAMVEGPNFRFGKDRRGDIETLRELCEQHGVRLSIVNGQSEDGEWISSSRVRTLIARGEILAANRLLVEPYRLTGIIGRGAARGRQIGFPTANLEQVPVMVPAAGVYAGRCCIGDRFYPAAMNIGPNPTFGEAAHKVEVHVIDFIGDLYGQKLEVEVLEQLRGVQEFSGIEALVAQLKKDVNRAKIIANIVDTSSIKSRF